MSKGILRDWLVATLALSTTFVDGAVMRLSFEELTHRSKWIVTGTVVRLESSLVSMAGVGECLVTDVTLRVESRVKGPEESGRPETSEVVLRILGGELNDTWQRCLEAPRYRLKERVLVFLREHQGKLWNTGWQQGKYTLLDDGQTVHGRPLFPIATRLALSRVRGQIELYNRFKKAPSKVPGKTFSPAAPKSSRTED